MCEALHMSDAHQGALEKPTSRLATKHGSNVRYGSSLVQVRINPCSGEASSKPLRVRSQSLARIASHGVRASGRIVVS